MPAWSGWSRENTSSNGWKLLNGNRTRTRIELLSKDQRVLQQATNFLPLALIPQGFPLVSSPLAGPVLLPLLAGCCFLLKVFPNSQQKRNLQFENILNENKGKQKYKNWHCHGPKRWRSRPICWRLETSCKLLITKKMHLELRTCKHGIMKNEIKSITTKMQYWISQHCCQHQLPSYNVYRN